MKSIKQSLHDDLNYLVVLLEQALHSLSALCTDRKSDSASLMTTSLHLRTEAINRNIFYRPVLIKHRET